MFQFEFTEFLHRIYVVLGILLSKNLVILYSMSGFELFTLTLRLFYEFTRCKNCHPGLEIGNRGAESYSAYK